MRLDTVRTGWRGLERWERLAVAAWGVLVLVVCVRALATPRIHSLYPVFARAARNWRTEQPLYTQPSQGTDQLDVYRYSPLVAALLAPLSVLPDRLGSVLWRLLNAGVCLAGLAWWCRAVLPWPLTRAQRAVLFLLVLPMCVGNLNNAQSNPLVFGLVLGTVAAAAEKRWNWAAGCMALACLFKLYPIAVGLLVAVVYPRRFPARLAAALAVGAALPFLLQHPGYVTAQYGCWFEYLAGDDRSALPLERCYRDLQLLSRLWFGPMPAGLYPGLQLLAGAGIALLGLTRRSTHPRHLLTLLTALGCCWMTVFGPATESCTYILLGPTLAWALVEAWLAGRPTWMKVWLLGSYGLLVATYMSCWFPAQYRLQRFGLQPLAGVLLLAYLSVRTFLEAPASPASQSDEEVSLPARAA